MLVSCHLFFPWLFLSFQAPSSIKFIGYFVGGKVGACSRYEEALVTFM